jgi:hypothetical protein
VKMRSDIPLGRRGPLGEAGRWGLFRSLLLNGLVAGVPPRMDELTSITAPFV